MYRFPFDLIYREPFNYVKISNLDSMRVSFNIYKNNKYTIFLFEDTLFTERISSKESVPNFLKIFDGFAFLFQKIFAKILKNLFCGRMIVQSWAWNIQIHRRKKNLKNEKFKRCKNVQIGFCHAFLF